MKVIMIVDVREEGVPTVDTVPLRKGDAAINEERHNNFEDRDHETSYRPTK
jgi:hypothetical protein